MPFFSIITVTYNASQYIESSINSVVDQSLKDFEYIIVDGESTDGTIDIINRHKENIDVIVIEPDNGIYDAMNKAIDLATGKYLIFLGADDILFDENTLLELKEYLSEKKLDLLVGNVLYTSGRLYVSSFGLTTLLHNTIHHQGAIYNRKLFKDFRYDTSFSLIADYELNLSIYKFQSRFHIEFISRTISICTDGGASRNQINKSKIETALVRRKILGPISMIYQILYRLKLSLSNVVSSQRNKV